MARAVTYKQFFTFVNGLNSEANPLTFPEGTSSSEENFELLRNGSRKRRLGMDYEDNWDDTLPFTNLTDNQVQTWAISNYVWTAVGGDGTRNALITQIGPYILLYDIGADSVSSNQVTSNFTKDGTGLGRSYLILSTDFPTTYTTASGDPVELVSVDHIDVSFGKGKAFVTAKNIEPFYIEYHTDTNSYSSHVISMQMRDFIGLDDGYDVDVDVAATSLSNYKTNAPIHYYNAINQGWTDANLTTYITANSAAPAHSKVMYLGKDSTDVFTVAWLDKQYFGTSYPPRGKLIYNPWNINRTAYNSSLVAADHNELENFRPSATTFYAGRVWYAGVESDKYGGTLFFTRVIESVKTDAGHFLSDNDPTAEHSNELLASDGGTIEIPEAGFIHTVLVMNDSLLIWATGGVWQINGGTDSGFAADNFVVRKVSSVGTLYKQSIVLVEGVPIYWSDSGIYTIAPDESGLSLRARNLTESTIQTLYVGWITPRNDIVGLYDDTNKIARWLFNPSSAETVDERFTHVLNLDIVLGAFSVHTIADDSEYPHVCGGFANRRLVNANKLKYATMIKNATDDWSFTFSEFKYNLFKDWYTFDTAGLDYLSFIETGHEIEQDAMRNKQVDYLFTHFERTELTATDGTLNNPSGCMMTVKFDFSDHSASGKETTAVQAYKLLIPYMLQYSTTTPGTETFNYGREVITTKHAVFGEGKGVQLRFESETGKDCRLLGWSIVLSGVTIP